MPNSRLRERGPCHYGLYEHGVLHHCVSTHTKYPPCRLCQDSGMRCTADGLSKQMAYHGVRKGSSDTGCYRSLCERLVLRVQSAVCVGKGLVPVSAPLQLNPLLKSSIPEQVPMPTTCTQGNRSDFPQREAAPSSHTSPKGLVFLFFFPSSLLLCAV